MRLNLEYHITKAEKKEALALHQEARHGKIVKWILVALFCGFVAIEVVVLLLRFIFEIKSRERPMFFAILLVVLAVVFTVKRLTRRKADDRVRLEVSDGEMVFEGNGGRVMIPWDAFSKFMESSNLFVLLDGTKQLLYMVPKRAFPDQAAQDWFRIRGNQPRSVAPARADEVTMPGRFTTGKGIAFTTKLKFGDYWNRAYTSWRYKGIALGMMLLVTVICLVMPDPPDAVNSRSKTLLIMVAMMVPMFAVVFSVVIGITWLAERKLRKPQHVALSEDGIEFAAQTSSGRLPWSSYQFYLENRWAFFVWNPRGSLWFMFPKRDFASQSDLMQCRELLEKNLKRSRWFFM